MYEEIKALLEQEDYRQAKQKIHEIRCGNAKKAASAELDLLEASACEAQGDRIGEYLAISSGLSKDPQNYEMYYMLGLWYRSSNINQAYLCFERALQFCTEIADYTLISEEMENCRMREDFSVRNVSVMVLSYNDKALMKKCIEALYKECSEEDEIVVVDNASTDGVKDWLRLQTKIRFIENGDNVGFPVGCNVGIIACSKDNDVLLLNNDAVLTKGALFWLRMGLYESREVGAAGAVSNNALEQTVQGTSGNDKITDAFKYGETHNIPMLHPYEDRICLTGFCILFSRNAVNSVLLEEIGEGTNHERKLLFDPVFTPAYFEDDDLGIRISQAGYRQLLCCNAFVYHKGGEASGTSFNHSKEDIMQKSREMFCKKWGFDVWSYVGIADDLIDAVNHIKTADGILADDPDTPIRYLEIGCGPGTNLSAIRHRFPYAYTAGVESRADLAGYGRFMGDIVSGNAEDILLPWAKKSFDIICIYDALMNAENKDLFMKKIGNLLRDDGTLIVSKKSRNLVPENIKVVEI